MKLEIKHIVPYLPYELKFLYHGNIYKIRWINSIGDIDYDSEIDFINPFPPNIFSKELDLVKLMFRPLSDLNKEIEVNGERFVPIERLFEVESNIDRHLNYLEIEQQSLIGMKYIPFGIVNKLFEWHFDVFGLIEDDLAININTLNLK
jgi:hypothetical protein